MRYLRLVLIMLLIALCLGSTVQFWLMVAETQKIEESCSQFPQFSCDAFPEHVVGAFHALSYVLLAAVIFARKYYWALGLSATYFVLNIFATYARLGTGVFGGDMCPDGHPCLRAIRRASGFDWAATSILIISLLMITTIIIMKWKAERPQ